MNTTERSMEVSQKLKRIYHMAQMYHSRAFTLRTPRQCITDIRVTVCCNTVHNGYTMEAAHVSNNTCGVCKQRNFIVEESYSIFRKAFAAADVK